MLVLEKLLVAANNPMIHNASNFVQLLCYLTCNKYGKATS
jgi:hypothetical protein